MNTETDLATLQQEVARLRREMNELRQFIHYHPPGTGDDDQPQSAYLDINCTFFSIFHPDNPSLTQARIMAGPNGACITLAGKDEKTRLLLVVEKDVPELSLFSKAGQYAATLRVENGEPQFDLFGRQGQGGVQMTVAGEEQHGQVGVCAAGRPRAVMKSTETGGAISAVHDDGHPRITVISTEENGELLAVSQDMKVGVKISANGPDGGFISVNHQNGKAGVIIGTTALCGAVLVNDKEGKMIKALPSVQ